MANYYLTFSEVLETLTAEEEAWLRSQLESGSVAPEQGADGDHQWTGPRFLKDYRDQYDDDDPLGFQYEFQYEFDDDRLDGWGCGLWIYAEESGDPGEVAWLVQKFLQKFRPSQCWSMTYAMTCSKPFVGDFGGGAAFVTAAEIKWHRTDDFVAASKQAFLNQEKREHGQLPETPGSPEQ